MDELRLEGGEALEVGEAPLVGGITTGLGLGAGDEEEEVLFLLRPKGWKDLNREFMRSMYGERRGGGGWERNKREAMRGGGRGGKKGKGGRARLNTRNDGVEIGGSGVEGEVEEEDRGSRLVMMRIEEMKERTLGR